jgi:DNA modification methylase
MYVAHMVEVFREVRRVLRPDGTLWLNLGDSYAANWSSMRSEGGGGFKDVARERTKYPPPGLKSKDLVGIPWRVAFALQADGWYLRSDIIWAKPNPMPESVTDRPTKSHEYLFLLTKNERYFYDATAIREPHVRLWDGSKPNGNSLVGGSEYTLDAGAPTAHRREEAAINPNPFGRNARTVWTIATQPYPNVPARRVGVDGTDRRWSPSCPVHAGQHHLDATDAHGEPRDASPSGRTTHTDVRPAPPPLGEHVPIGLTPAEDSARDSSGSSDPVRAETATPRSKGTRKTGHAPAISPHETADAASQHHTGRTSQSPALDAIDDRSHASRSAEDSAADGSEIDRADRMTHRSGCTCTSLVSVSHFAVFPEAIPERCIKAGSAAQACAVCGAPWERVTDGGGADMEGRYARGEPARRGLNGAAASGASDVGGFTRARSTTGWQPTCAHDAGTSSSVILDPFNGSGTTGRVALRLGRRYVGLDLSREYLSEQALHRIDPLAAAAAVSRAGGEGAQGIFGGLL